MREGGGGREEGGGGREEGGGGREGGGRKRKGAEEGMYGFPSEAMNKTKACAVMCCTLSIHCVLCYAGTMSRLPEFISQWLVAISPGAAHPDNSPSLSPIPPLPSLDPYSQLLMLHMCLTMSSFLW